MQRRDGPRGTRGDACTTPQAQGCIDLRLLLGATSNGRVGAHRDAIAAAHAPGGVNHGDSRRDRDLALVEEPDDLERCGSSVRHRVGHIPRPLAGARQHHAGRARLDRAQLRVRLSEPAVGRTPQAKQRCHPAAVVLRLDGVGQDNHVNRYLHPLSELDILDLNVELLCDRIFGNLPWPPLDEMDSLVAHPSEELFVSLAKGAHVQVEIVDFGAGLVSHEVRLLQRVHAAEA